MRLLPFFTYFGGKWRAAGTLYPEPKHETIIEPFAGSAGYALNYSNRNVLLCDKDPIIQGVWSYLLRAKQAEIMSLPDIADGATVDDYALSAEQKWLIGFWLNKGSARPEKKPSSWMKSNLWPMSQWGPHIRQRIASQLQYIRHWRLCPGDYTKCPDIVASWFIDPPYQDAGKRYRFGSKQICFEDLSLWCRHRRGQVIVCENEGASWLPFAKGKSLKGLRGKRTIEVHWTQG